jgi:Fe2+ transport system protein FeoA
MTALPISPPASTGDRDTVPLSALHGGATGRLHAAQLACDDCELLNAMGLTDQCEIRVCRAGEPCIVQVHGTRLGLAAALAKRIFITINRANPTTSPQRV